MSPITETLLILWLFMVVGVVFHTTFRTWKKRRHFVKLIEKFPGPRFTLPIVGDLLWLLLGDPKTILQRGIKMWQPFAPRMRFWFMHKGVVGLSDPNDMEIIFSNPKHSVKPYTVYRLVESFFGRSVLTLNGPEWREHRKAISPSFHFSVLERYADIFLDRAQILTKRMAQRSGGSDFELLPIVATTSNETICETAFGCEANGESKGDREAFIEDMEAAFHIMQYRALHPWLMIDTLFGFTEMAKQHRIAEKKINDYATAAIRTRKQAIGDAKLGGGIEEDEIGVRQRYSFLDLMLTQNKGLSETDIIGEVRTLIGVQETSSTSLCFALLMMAMHEDIQNQVLAEIEDVWNRPGLTSLQRLHALHLQDRVFKETLRLFPPVPLLGREAMSDIELSDGKVIPSGSWIVLLIFIVHRDPHIYPEPEEFNPDRFLPENCVGRHPYAFVPFSAGLRNCVGQKYGMLQMKAVFSNLVRHYKIILPDGAPRRVSDIPLTVDTFLKQLGGTRVRIEKRSPAVAGA